MGVESFVVGFLREVVELVVIDTVRKGKGQMNQAIIQPDRKWRSLLL